MFDHIKDKRGAERRRALAPARLVVQGPDGMSGELRGDLLDISEGGASLEISNADEPLVQVLRQQELTGTLHVLLPDGEEVVELPMETVWLVEYIFGGHHRLAVGMRTDGSEAAQAVALRLLQTLPVQPEDNTLS